MSPWKSHTRKSQANISQGWAGQEEWDLLIDYNTRSDCRGQPYPPYPLIDCGCGWWRHVRNRVSVFVVRCHHLSQARDKPKQNKPTVEEDVWCLVF